MTADILQLRDYGRRDREEAAAIAAMPLPSLPPPGRILEPGCHVIGFKSREVLELEQAAATFEQAASDLNSLLIRCLEMQMLIAVTKRLAGIAPRPCGVSAAAVQPPMNLATMTRETEQLSRL